MKSGRLGDAEPLLRRLAAERPDDAGIHLQLGRVLAAEGKKDDAIAEIQTALKLAPSDADAQRELADLYASAGKNDLAEAAYRALAHRAPERSRIASRSGTGSAAREEVSRSATGISGGAPAETRLARHLRRSGLCGQREQELRTDGQSPQWPRLFNAEMPAVCFFLRASAYDHLHDYKNAAVDYHQFLDVANGKYPDQEWQATHRLVAIEPKKH